MRLNPDTLSDHMLASAAAHEQQHAAWQFKLFGNSPLASEYYAEARRYLFALIDRKAKA